jgi:hypothetical protein
MAGSMKSFNLSEGKTTIYPLWTKLDLRPLADLLVPLLQRPHNDNGAKLRLDMLNAKAENGVPPGHSETPSHAGVKVSD